MALTGTTEVLGLSAFVVLYAAGLFTAVAFALFSRDTRVIIAAGVLLANFFGYRLAWGSVDSPLYITAAVDTIAAAYFILVGRSRWEVMIGGTFALAALATALAMLGAIPLPADRLPGIVRWNQVDIVTNLGHLANALLGFAAGDSGLRVRGWFRLRPWALLDSS